MKALEVLKTALEQEILPYYVAGNAGPLLELKDRLAEKILCDLTAAGLAIVPREPTEEMRLAGFRKCRIKMRGLHCRNKDCNVGAVTPPAMDTVWQAMVGASEEAK